MRKLRLIKLNDWKKRVDLVRDSSWVNIHVFYKNETKLFQTGVQLPLRLVTRLRLACGASAAGSRHKVCSSPGDGRRCQCRGDLGQCDTQTLYLPIVITPLPSICRCGGRAGCGSWARPRGTEQTEKPLNDVKAVHETED